MAITNKCLDKWISEALSEDSLIQRYFMETTGKPLTGEVLRKSWILDDAKGSKYFVAAYLRCQDSYLKEILQSRHYLVGAEVKITLGLERCSKDYVLGFTANEKGTEFCDIWNLIYKFK